MVITPSDERPFVNIFVAGTIDMGNSVDWQAEFVKHIDSEAVKIYNPRRRQGEAPKTNEELEFQVKWELRQIQKADAIFMNFLPGSKSPITLLELGLCLMMPEKIMVVVCPPEYSRAMNVKVTVQAFARPNLRLADNFHTGMEDFAVMLRKIGTVVPKKIED
jgi:hypothetical protein